MKDYFTFLSAVGPVFFAVGLGMWFRKKNWLSEAADGSLLRLIVNALLPALILDAILQNSALKNPGNVFLAPLSGFFMAVIGMGLAFLCGKYGGKFLGLASHNSLWTFVLCVSIYSYSYVPLALAKMLFGSDTTGVLLAHNFGVEISLWTLGLIFLGVTGVLKGWKRIVNPPFVAVIVGLILNFFNLDQFLPRFFLWSIGLLGQCAVPLGLILIGVALADQWHEFRAKDGWKVMLGACVLRLGLLPILFLLLARFVPFSTELRQVIVLQSAMPAAVVPVLLMVKYYGGDSVTAMRVIVSTSVASLITMPLWILVGLKIAGLPLLK
jgi:predicted permease